MCYILQIDSDKSEPSQEAEDGEEQERKKPKRKKQKPEKTAASMSVPEIFEKLSGKFENNLSYVKTSQDSNSEDNTTCKQILDHLQAVAESDDKVDFRKYLVDEAYKFRKLQRQKVLNAMSKGVPPLWPSFSPSSFPSWSGSSQSPSQMQFPPSTSQPYQPQPSYPFTFFASSS